MFKINQHNDLKLTNFAYFSTHVRRLLLRKYNFRYHSGHRNKTADVVSTSSVQYWPKMYTSTTTTTTTTL